MCWSIAGVFTFFSSRRMTSVNSTVTFGVSTPSRLFARSFRHCPRCERSDLGRMRVWMATWWQRTCSSISRRCCVSTDRHFARTCCRCSVSLRPFLAFSRFQYHLAPFSILRRPLAFPIPPSSCLLFVTNNPSLKDLLIVQKQRHFKKSKRSAFPSLYSLPKRESSVSKRGGSFSTVSTLCK